MKQTFSMYIHTYLRKRRAASGGTPTRDILHSRQTALPAEPPRQLIMLCTCMYACTHAHMHTCIPACIHVCSLYSCYEHMSLPINLPMYLLSTPVYQGRDTICLVQTLKIRPAQLSCLGGSAGRAVCLECRMSRVGVPPEAALLFLLEKKGCLRASLLAFALSL